MIRVERNTRFMVDAFLSLGSNMGDRLGHLQAAVHSLAQSTGVDIVKVSSIYETDPWGLEDQRPFFNAVIWIRTDLLPMELLRVCQSVERQRDRIRGIRWGPRTLDIDILRYDDQTINNLELTIPDRKSVV